MKTMAHIKLDSTIKTKAQKLATDLGFSLSAVVNAQLREFVRTQSLSVQSAPRMTPALTALLGPIEADIKAGRNLSKPHKSAKDIDEWFESL